MVFSRILRGVLTSSTLLVAAGICLTPSGQAQQMTPTFSKISSGSTVEAIVTRPRRVIPVPEEASSSPVSTTKTTEPLPLLLRPKTLTLTNDDFPSGKRTDSSLLTPFVVSLQRAIDEKLGIRYRYHGQDSGGYDCSGFVWSAFRDAGIDFTRSSAADYYYAFPDATPQERTQFGTLIFFNGLSHVGIVKDENYFYHASTKWGITLARFDDYWKSRVTGYRCAAHGKSHTASSPIIQDARASR